MELRYGTPNEAGMLPDRVAHARDLCARWVEEGHTPTLAVCVARRGVMPFDFTDAALWNSEQYGSTFSFGDLDGDKRVDVCARGIYGISCSEGP